MHMLVKVKCVWAPAMSTSSAGKLRPVAVRLQPALYQRTLHTARQNSAMVALCCKQGLITLQGALLSWHRAGPGQQHGGCS